MSLRRTLSFSASLAALGMAVVVVNAPASAARADEGMWTFDNFPIATVNEKYGTNIDQAWLDRVRNAAIRELGSVGGHQDRPVHDALSQGRAPV